MKKQLAYLLILYVTLIATAQRAHCAWIEFLDGSAVPAAPWLPFIDARGEEPGETIIIDFQEGGQANKAMRLNSGIGANEYYVGAFADPDDDEVVGGIRFRMVSFSETGKENILSITTRSKHLAPAPALTLVDGRFKLWTYVESNTEIIDIGPADTNVFHIAYLFARADGWVKFFWDGKILYDNFAPQTSPYDAYMEWGSGSWQFNATDVIDFDWVGYGTMADMPVGILTTPPNGALFQNAAAGLTIDIVSQTNLASGVAPSGIKVTVNGADRTSSLAISGDNYKRKATLSGLASNQVYKVMIQVVDLGGVTNSLPIEFDTFSRNTLVIEAEDFNFEGGKFLDQIVLSSRPAPDNYWERVGVEDVDHNEASTEPGNTPHVYRQDSLIGTQRTRDTLRRNYVEAQTVDPGVVDFNVTAIEDGEWLNYTRTVLAGTYLLYGRFAATTNDFFEATVSRVTGATNQKQTATVLGTFKGGPGRGRQTYDYSVLSDAQGNPVRLTLSGKETLRVTATQGVFNANFYVLAPADTTGPLPKLQISRAGANIQLTWDAPGFVLETAPRIPGTWTVVPNATSPLSVANTGAAFYRLRK
ncbi:MAG: hypothetical protein FJ403_23625 [Verrucomicrobia bacterium]|nr:hypothetical protein [Verrucomicrobiota bacterium]